ncbi:hypothetical protein C1752_00801 [Acaryochloris thomasi RCC1774]|uniref:DUF3122 domain-containing protein n=2 Tax=Acaryochloris TaxID=155977 RepID=A0A2W1JNA7_9CYAN|nr:hypothetical protein C1752_00801 [Acaryochloris thomasi RCC1774]
MFRKQRQTIGYRVCALILFMSLFLGGTAGSAAAEVYIHPDNDGQMLYQTRRTLQDQRGYTWQAVAFKFARSGSSGPLQLRLVGFPGTVELDHEQPLMLLTSLGQKLTVDNVSDQVSKTNPTEPHVGQWNLQPVLIELGNTMFLDLSISTADHQTLRLAISPDTIEEWQTVAACSATWCGS